jgi:hypothetical protein
MNLTEKKHCVRDFSFLFFLQDTQLLDISVPAAGGPAGVFYGSGSRGQNGMKNRISRRETGFRPHKSTSCDVVHFPHEVAVQDQLLCLNTLQKGNKL